MSDLNIPSRIVETPSGWAWIKHDPQGPLGFSVTFKRYDEEGWEIDRNIWTRWRTTGNTLAGFLSVGLDLPADQAVDLADEITGKWPGEWEARSGKPIARLSRPLLALFYAFYATIVLLVIGLAAAGVVLSISLLAS